VLEIKISCACVINRLVNISIQIFRSKYVRIRLQTSTSSFFKNSEKPTVNFGSYRKHMSEAGKNKVHSEPYFDVSQRVLNLCIHFIII